MPASSAQRPAPTAGCTPPSTPVERRAGVDRAAFEQEYMAAPGRPVIVTDAMDRWAARTKWTFDFFAERFGDRTVVVTDRLARPTVGRRVSMREYLLYARMPFTTFLAQVETPRPFYLTSFSPFADHPELLEDFDDPYFVDNVYRRELQGPLLRWYFDNFSWIFIGPPGTLSPLHVDLFGTHAWLAQVAGRKRFLLFPPEDAAYLYEGEVDFDRPDLERWPLLARARPFEAVLHPGEVIFIPTGWLHRVVSLDSAISVTLNFVNRSNLAAHLAAVGRDLPLWLRKIDQPAFREGAGARWTPRDLLPGPAQGGS